MDLVVNHCSDQHEWFQKALADPEGEYADYFYFIKGKDGKAPSNYRSYFGGSAWSRSPEQISTIFICLPGTAGSELGESETPPGNL